MTVVIANPTAEKVALPGGPDTSVQFNSAGNFGGNADFTWDGATLKVRSFAELQDLTNQDPTASDTIEANIKLTSLDNNLFGFIGLDGNDSLDFIHYAYDGIIRLLTTDANGSDYGIEIGPAFFQLQSAVGGSFEQIIVTDSDSAATVADVDIEMKAPVTFDFGLIVEEAADHPRTPSAGKGQYWIRDDTPNTPMFTDDAGNDYVLNATGTGDVVGPASSVDDRIATFDGVTGKLIQDSGTLVSDLALSTRTLTAGAGMTGGGDLTADRTFDVIANADGSITVNANDIQVGVLATDAQHGNRGNGALHTNFDAATAGFVPGSGGGAVNFLRADGTWSDPTPVFGTEFEQGISLGEVSTTSNTYVTAYTFTSASLPAGDYKIEWFADKGEQSDKESSHRVLIDGTEVSNSEWRIKEGTEDDGTAWLDMSGHRILTLGAGTHTVAFQYRTDATAYLRNMQVSLFRVA
ncbi:MAG: hypothetical protein ACR2P1_25655 [Pseudomonadales bacterium]